MARVRPSALSSRGEDYRVRIPRKICFGLMGPFRRVNALVRLENVCTRHDRGKRNGFFSKGRRKEKKKGGKRAARRGLLEARGYKVPRAEFMDTGETVSWNRQIKQKSSCLASRNRSYWRGCKFLEI